MAISKPGIPGERYSLGNLENSAEMTCRSGCGACCIAISISSPIPGMPDGKKAGERCIHLGNDNICRIHETEKYPDVCGNLTPSPEMCGADYQEAYAYLENLERLTTPR